jgi:hypothetical protein
MRQRAPCQASFHSRTEPGTSPSGMNVMMSTKMMPSAMFQRST